MWGHSHDPEASGKTTFWALSGVAPALPAAGFGPACIMDNVGRKVVGCMALAGGRALELAILARFPLVRLTRVKRLLGVIGVVLSCCAFFLSLVQSSLGSLAEGSADRSEVYM